MKKLSVLLACTLGLGVMTGCTSKPTSQTNVIRIALNNDPPTLDPQVVQDTVSIRVLRDLYEGLTDLNYKGDAIPGLAASWQVSSDGKTYTFKLRSGIKFSNGQPITVKDVLFSLRRSFDMKLPSAATGPVYFNDVVGSESVANGKAGVETLGFKALDANTVQVQLNYPDPSILIRLAMPTGYVISQKAVTSPGYSWSNVKQGVYSGAYMLTEHVVNGSLTAVKNPYYYQAPAIEKIKYYIYNDPNSALAAYRTNQVDIVDANLVDAATIRAANSDANMKQQLTFIKYEGTYVYNLNTEIIKSRDVREALTMAVNREELAKVFSNGYRPLYSFITPTVDDGAYAASNSFYFDPARYNRNNYPYCFVTKVGTQDSCAWPNSYSDRQNLARRILAKEGITSSNPLRVTIKYNTLPLHEQGALAVQSMWNNNFKGAVVVSFSNEDWKSYLQDFMASRYDIARMGDAAAYNSVQNYFGDIAKTNYSYFRYDNQKFYDLLAKANLSVDKQSKVLANTQAIELALTDYLVIPLLQASWPVLMSSRVGGMTKEQIENCTVANFETKWFNLK